MGIQVEIVSLLQKVDLDTMLMTNQLVMRLPNGDEVKLLVSDEETTKILNARVGAPAALPPPPSEDGQSFQSTSLTPSMNAETDVAFEFGGGGTQPAPRTDEMAEEHPTSPATPAAPRKRMTVTNDGYGYPVVHGKEGRDPGEIVDGSGPKDEDGVGSI